MQDDDLMEKIVSLSKRRGFVFPGSEIYGGLANSWDLGPLGAQLSKNLKDDWWKTFVESRQDMVGIDGSIIMNPKVWQASGHVDTFHDPLVEDVKTHKRYRADHLLEEALGIDASGMSIEEIAKMIKDKGLKSPDGNDLTEPKNFSGMFETTIGPIQEEGSTVYLRPETAQAIFVNFKNVLETTRKRLPFGIAQIGKAFRNEITPGNFIFRVLEFEQMEVEYFIEEEEWKERFEEWNMFMEMWGKSIGLDMDKLSRLEVSEEGRAHYSKRTIDFEFDFPFGRKELWGLAYRGDYDLSAHMKSSKQSLEYTDPNDQSRKLVPHVIEPSLGVGRTMLAVMLSAYTEEAVGDDTRVVMKFPKHLAPYKIAVLPLSKKDELVGPSQKIVDALSDRWNVTFDETQAIGKRYRRQDEIGTPYCVTVDFDSLEDGAVTVRDRDTMEQERVKIQELVKYFEGKLQ